MNCGSLTLFSLSKPQTAVKIEVSMKKVSAFYKSCLWIPNNWAGFWAPNFLSENMTVKFCLSLSYCYSSDSSLTQGQQGDHHPAWRTDTTCRSWPEEGVRLWLLVDIDGVGRWPWRATVASERDLWWHFLVCAGRVGRGMNGGESSVMGELGLESGLGCSLMREQREVLGTAPSACSLPVPAPGPPMPLPLMLPPCRHSTPSCLGLCWEKWVVLSCCHSYCLLLLLLLVSCCQYNHYH